MRLDQKSLDEWWRSLAVGEKQTAWVLYRMLLQMKDGARVEVRRHGLQAKAVAVDAEEVRKAERN